MPSGKNSACALIIVPTSRLSFIILSSIAIGGFALFFWQLIENERLAGQHDAATRFMQRQLQVQADRVREAEAGLAAMQAASLRFDPRAQRPVRPEEEFVSLSTSMARADRLRADGKPQEALDEYLRAYHALRAIRPASSESQILSSSLARLAKSFGPAKDALRELRDEAMQDLTANPEDARLATEVAILNQRLGEDSLTIALYDALAPDDPRRQGLAAITFPALVESGRYADALVGKPLGSMLNALQAGIERAGTLIGSNQNGFREHLVNDTAANIEVLAGAGKLDDAQVLAERLLAFDSSESARAKVVKHLDRAGATRRR